MVSDFSPNQATLASNTGYDSQNRSNLNPPKFTVAIDWLDISFRSLAGRSEAYELVTAIEVLLGESLYFSAAHPAFNGIQYDGSGRSKSGAIAWFKETQIGDCGEFEPAVLKLAFPGSVLSTEFLSQLAEMLVVLSADQEIDCTRIDIALDDHEKLVKMGKIAAARKRGNFFNCTYTELVASSNRGETDSVTLYFGAKGSDKRLRIYDKTLESNSKVLGNRWEAQFRRKAAYEVFSLWLQAAKIGEGAISSQLRRIVLGLVDFRDRSGGGEDRNRCRPLLWFSKLIIAVNAEPCRIVVKAPEKSIQRSIRWIAKSVASTLAMIKISLADEFLPYIKRAIGEGSAKLTNLRREIAYTTGAHELLY